MNQPTKPGKSPGSLFHSRSGIALIGFLAIIAFLLTTEHRAHVMGLLPFAILLACPLLHVFHHSGRHGSPEEPPETTRRHEHNVRGGER